MTLAPIVLFVYDRLGHTQQAIDTLRKNYLAGESELFVFSDAARNEKSEKGVGLVREYLRTIDGFKKVVICEQENNLGPSRSIIRGVTTVINRYGKAVVLEDDLAVSPYFLKFMNEALLFYEKEERVISINGFMYPIKIKERETFFLRIADCWGWATWKRGWDLFEPDANKLLERLRAEKMLKRFNIDGRYDFLRILKKQTKNQVSSWAICWYASSLSNNKLSLFPAKSLVRNIGLDGSGTHCGYNVEYDADILQEQVPVSRIPVQEDKDLIKEIGIFLKACKFKRLSSHIGNILSLRFRKRKDERYYG